MSNPSTKHMVKDEKGNLISFEQLYDTYFQAIFNYTLRRVASVAEAEDLTSQTFFKALNNLWKFRWTKGSFSAWLYRIATNEVTNHYRKKKYGSLSDAHAQAIPDDRRADSELDQAEQALAQHQMFLSLNQALQNLKPDEQTLIVLRYFEQKSFAEIGEILRKRPGSLTMRTHRALKKLKMELERRGIDYERIRRSFAEPTETGYQGGNVQAGLAS